MPSARGSGSSLLSSQRLCAPSFGEKKTREKRTATALFSKSTFRLYPLPFLSLLMKWAATRAGDHVCESPGARADRGLTKVPWSRRDRAFHFFFSFFSPSEARANRNQRCFRLANPVKAPNCLHSVTDFSSFRVVRCGVRSRTKPVLRPIRYNISARIATHFISI